MVTSKSKKDKRKQFIKMTYKGRAAAFLLEELRLVMKKGKTSVGLNRKWLKL